MIQKTAWLAIFFAVTLGAQSNSKSKHESSGESVGAVDKLKGHVYWSAKPGAPEKPLTDPHQYLHLGEVYHCGPDGSVTLQLSGGPQLLKPNDIYTITWTPDNAQKDVMMNASIAFKTYSRPGASERGADDDYLLAPADGSTVIPARFTIRWTPVDGSVALKLWAEGRTIWHETVADGASGVLESAAARQAIASAGAGSLTLTFSSAAGNGEASFTAISRDQQAALDTELNSWDRQDSSFMRRIGRASAFDQRRMFAEAAQEYEAALAESPDSADLLASTIRAEKRAGNPARARQLQARVTSSASKP